LTSMMTTAAPCPLLELSSRSDLVCSRGSSPPISSESGHVHARSRSNGL
jgi:hypothetical protein